jgi:hypothetical protein
MVKRVEYMMPADQEKTNTPHLDLREGSRSPL